MELDFNLIDYAFYGITAVIILVGLYQGFIKSTANSVAFFVSYFAASKFYTRLSVFIINIENVYKQLSHYIDGAKHIRSLPDGIELAKATIDSLPTEKISSIISQANLPPPFSDLLSSNITNRVLESQQVVSLADYFDYSIVAVTLNIISFLLILVVLFFIFSALINMFNYVFKFKKLRILDSIAGGLVSLIKVKYILYCVAILVPLIFVLVDYTQIEFINDIVVSSTMLAKYLTNNPLMQIIRGFI